MKRAPNSHVSPTIIRRFLADVSQIAVVDPFGTGAAARSLLEDHYRLAVLSSPDDPAAASADLLLLFAPLSSPPSAGWPRLVWVQPGVPLPAGVPPSGVTVVAGVDIAKAFADRFLSSCSA